MNHPALTTDNVAVVTGGADGIGLAACRHLHSLGLRVCIADNNADKLARAQAELDNVLTVVTDVASFDEVRSLREAVYREWGRVDVLMNNAGNAFGTNSWGEYDNWQATLQVNLFGVINGVQNFVPAMREQNSPGLIINTGSKQGITNPPGDPAYNVSKAGIRALTEHLQHDFRSQEGCQLSAHLLVPGFTYTGLIQRWLPERPPGAWLPEQVTDYLFAALERGDFYILCPDNDVSREVDNKRMAWTMGDLVENRPPLSRWHPDFEAPFRDYMEK